ncbi:MULTISPECIES: ABC transporter ATP-binding protein [Nocardiaceae]|uniref:ABC-2 type transport system ATP-binding protein n=1 Tax=Rhodococcoides corynebacterioides TaxID=53972 RepID=A0ABS2KUK7_9NOCA|nr:MULTISPECIES: ABC transporter ATP-binding protein [Rhodococcus]MBM7415491.1 ABC-2 type transport system ATP-binding protein [Rhodococcus corynebacterioides]MBP1117953.1 ABC-2 type transport system ATP-binding protein [Rhodococcus sp. PvP016]
MNDADNAIEIAGLVKRFGRHRALDGLDLTVSEGAVAGFLGPNGAGKSTTIRILLGLVHRDAGTVRLLGADPVRDAVSIHRRLAYVPGDVALWPRLTGGETIDLLLGMRGARVDVHARDSLIERFDLDPTRRVSTYSKGNRQKVVLIAAFAGHADLLVLDEPTSGLDPVMENVFAECVREIANRGTSVLLSSHILSEVEKLCETVTIIRAGRTVESGRLTDLRHVTTVHVTAEVSRDPGSLARTPGVVDLDVVASAETGRRRVTFSVTRADMPAAVAALGALGVADLTVAPPSLEELFLRYYDSDGDRS